MRVLIACEHTGAVRNAFIRAGHEAMSCDLLDTEAPGPHYMGDVRDVLGGSWDLMVAHPPCTYLSVSGLHWNSRVPGRSQKTEEGLNFVRLLMFCDIPRIAIENPVSCISTRIRKPDQVIQPWQFGHPESKATCLWLKALPRLVPTKDVYQHMMTLPLKERMRCHYASPGPDRWKLRSATYAGIAEAMANQWGSPAQMEIAA